jgi:hypothetical protein
MPNGRNDLTQHIVNAIKNFRSSHPRTEAPHIIASLRDAGTYFNDELYNLNVNPVPDQKKFDIDEIVRSLEEEEEKLPDKTFPPPYKASPTTNYFPVEWNDKGPILDSRWFIDIYKQLHKLLDLVEWEKKFLDERLEKAKQYPQVYFTIPAAAQFEILCYRAGIECPFHISHDKKFKENRP